MKQIVLLLTMLFLLVGCGTTQNNTAPDNSNTTNPNGEENTTGSGEDEEIEEDSSEADKAKKELIEKLKDSDKENLSGSINYSDNQFVFTVENNLGKDAEITFSSGQEYDYMVFDSNGKMVKKLSEDMMYTQAIKEVVLASGEKFTYSASYEEVASGLATGEYTIEFVFADKNFQASARETFDVE
ncbi:BsuPI-related putative proteinase inhibitor [Sutcliffiella halmapala]|uniref:BsuPI-related putative proteinase inhibitor n=1 Tax=Sutcliffiella halmapala TaxID=79882 RepID=UPI0009950C34|nr:BsuPI-related putative proteinase inhibitor [Sutcliffiella halmapala]